MYKVEVSNSAGKELAKIRAIDFKFFTRLSVVIDSLARDPYQGKKLKGQFHNDFSVRVGDYRIVYTIYKDKLIVYIIDVGHRKDIYR